MTAIHTRVPALPVRAGRRRQELCLVLWLQTDRLTTDV